MNLTATQAPNNSDHLRALTQDWGTEEVVDLYLGRCQVDTPHSVVREVWEHIMARRESIHKVLDFGAGDGRFSMAGSYGNYLGYEIDASRYKNAVVPPNVKFLNRCAFSENIHDADLCIGNPPYVRNQDLPFGWRQRAARVLEERTQITLSGLANAWQYFFLLSLASTKPDGLIALVIPFEWVSRPSARAVRELIQREGWNVSVYRLLDDTFHRVLTTSSITIIDKQKRAGKWEYFEQVPKGGFQKMSSPSGGDAGVLPYARLNRNGSKRVVAKRGLSPGTQEILTLTEGERARLGLVAGKDVVPCVTTLRTLTPKVKTLSEASFTTHFRDAGLKCWLIDTSKTPSRRLKAYLDHVPQTMYQTSTCLSRDDWWKFSMPNIPSILIATGFRQKNPKIIVNDIGARAVGGVCGVYGLTHRNRTLVANRLREMDLMDRVVPHSNGLRKLEINQLNSLLEKVLE